MVKFSLLYTSLYTHEDMSGTPLDFIQWVMLKEMFGKQFKFPKETI